MQKASDSAPALASFSLDALPVINHFLEPLDLSTVLEAYLPPPHPRRRVPPVQAIGLLLRNLLLSREPLYGIGAWASRFEPSLLGLPPEGSGLLNDDQVGRALDDLFDADRSSLILRIVVTAVREFHLSLRRFHNDSTTVSFQGEYREADGRRVRKKPTLRITFGHNKDHRPDLKQLLWSLTVTADGAVPVHYQALDGNTTDDQTHIATWNLLRAIAGRATFLYVADSKLCTRPQMRYIQGHGGRFLTVVPATRKEVGRFEEEVRKHTLPWEEVLRLPHPQRKEAPPDIFRAYEDPEGSVEGYRIVWFHSTEKEKRDRQQRQEMMDRAIQELRDLNDRLASPRTRFRKRAKVDEEIRRILEECPASSWLEVEVGERVEESFRQATRGRPGPHTKYRRLLRPRFQVTWRPRPEALTEAEKTDGLFPLITNDRKLGAKQMLRCYKLGQPGVEQRHHNLKAFHHVVPQYLKSVPRIEAFLCVYFLALLVNALIEREMRRAMKRRRLPALPLYPEGRPCKRPTTQQIFRIFEGLMVHQLTTTRGARYVYQPKLNGLQKKVLRLLGMRPQAYRISMG